MTTIQAGGPEPVGAGRRLRLASPVTATVLAALALILTALAIALSALENKLSILGSGPIIPVVVVYAGVGVVVARRQPRNPIGWILIGFIVLFLLSNDVGFYAAYAYRGHHGLPLAPVAVLLQPLWAPALVLFPVVILLFPDGSLASRRWRWVLVAYAVFGAVASVAVDTPAITAMAHHDVRLDAYGDVTSGGHSAGGGLAGAAVVLAVAGIFFIWLSFVGHQVLSWRRATGEQRQQLKWLASGGAVTLLLLAISFGISSTGVAGEILGIGLAGLPVGIGVGILKYRLYDIDRIISRAVSYTIVTGLLVGVYAGLVLLATQVMTVKSPVAVAAATLAAAALFNPLRRRVQHAVDRRFNRARYDADEAVAVFADRLKDAVDLDSVQDDLTGLVQRTLEPAHMSVWVSPRD